MSMSLYDIKDFDEFVTSLKSVTLHDQWHARVAKIGGKFFAALGVKGGLWVDCLVFKVAPSSYLMMLEQDGIKRAPYTSSTWPAVHKNSELTDDELKIYLARSYDIVANSLTRKKRQECGLD